MRRTRHLHGADLVLVDGREGLLGQQLLAHLAAAFAGVELVLALDVMAGLVEQPLAGLGQAFGQGLASGRPRPPRPLDVGDQPLQAAQAHLVQRAAGQQPALAGQADIARARALGRRLHRPGPAPPRRSRAASRQGWCRPRPARGCRAPPRPPLCSSGAFRNSSRLKKVSKQASNRATSSPVLARVVHSASLNSCRSVKPATSAAAMGVDRLGRRDAHVHRPQGARKKLSRVRCIEVLFRRHPGSGGGDRSMSQCVRDDAAARASIVIGLSTGITLSCELGCGDHTTCGGATALGSPSIKSAVLIWFSRVRP